MILYQQIADYLRNLIQQGIYGPGDKMPSIRTLAKQKQVSVATIQKAFEVLEQRGVLEAKAKSGFYVRIPIEAVDEKALFEQQIIPLCPSTVHIHEIAGKIFHDCDHDGVINLGTSYPDPYYLPIKQLQQISTKVIKTQMHQVVEVHFSPGLAALRKLLANRMIQAGCQIKADQLIVTNGCLEAMAICLRAVAQPGDTIAVESPVFVGLLQLIESMGYNALEIPCHPQLGLSLEALELALDQWPIKALAIVPTFSNPSGSNMPQNHRQRLVEMLAERNIPMIEDDLFADLAFDGGIIKPCKAYDKKGLVLYCASASKTIASGFRIGWIAPGAFYNAVEYYKTFTNISAPNFAQLVMSEFIQSGWYERHLRKLRSELALQVYKFQQWISEYFPPDVYVSHPQGGCVLWLRLPANIDAMVLQQRAIEQKIGFIPGQLFSTSHKFNHYIRINCACDPRLPLAQAIETLGKLIYAMA